MKKLVMAIVVLVMVGAMATSGWSTPIIYTGSISDGNGAQINPDPSSPWDDATLSWSVTQLTSGTWGYVYTWNDLGTGNERRNVSHLDFEVSSTFMASDLLSWSFGSAGGSLDGLGLVGPASNNELAGSVYGYKGDTIEGTGIYSFTLTLESTRAPMWGDFFLKDGNLQGNTDPIWFANSAYGTDTTASIGSGNAGGWVLVPDTQTSVPEPGTLLLLGSGLLGLGLFGRKKFRK